MNDMMKEMEQEVRSERERRREEMVREVEVEMNAVKEDKRQVMEEGAVPATLQH